MLIVDFRFNKSKVGGMFGSFSQLDNYDNKNNISSRFIGLRKAYNLKVFFISSARNILLKIIWIGFAPYRVTNVVCMLWG